MKIISCLRFELDFQGQIAAAFDQMMKLTDGRIDVFINNAGIGIGGPIEFCKIEDVQKQMDENFMGMVRWLSHVVPAMRKQGFGKILCISSIGGLIGLPYQGAYSASKFAMEGFLNRIHSDTKESQCRDGLRCLPFLCTFPRKHRERREQRPEAGLSRISNMPHSRLPGSISQSVNPRADGFLVSTIEQAALFPFQRQIADENDVIFRNVQAFATQSRTCFRVVRLSSYLFLFFRTPRP